MDLTSGHSDLPFSSRKKIHTISIYKNKKKIITAISIKDTQKNRAAKRREEEGKERKEEHKGGRRM